MESLHKYNELHCTREVLNRDIGSDIHSRPDRPLILRTHAYTSISQRYKA
jgi:hypothetical protein